MSRRESANDSFIKPVFDRVLEDKVKFSKYQYILYFFMGFVMIADGSEMTALSILLPVLQSEWEISKSQEGALGTILFVGVFLGSICSGIVSDRYGRRKSLAVLSFVQFLFGIISTQVKTVEAFIVLRGFFGLLIGFTIPIAPAMVSEMTPTAFRGKGVVIINFCFTIGKIYSVVTAKYTLTSLVSGDWRLMLLLSSVPSLVVSIGAFTLIKESPRYLIVSGHYNEGVETLNQIGEMNNGPEYVAITEQEKEEIIETQQQINLAAAGNTKPAFALLWTPEYRRITGCLWVIWYMMQFIEMGIIFILPFMLYAISGNSGSGTKGLNDMIFTVLMETPSIFVSLSIIEREDFGRKGSLSTMMTLVLAFFITIMILPSSLFVYLIALVKLSQKIAYGMLYPLTTELYPTKMRVSGFSFATAFGRLGAASMPSILLALFDAGTFAPIIGFIVLTIVILITTALVPYDTRGIVLDKQMHLVTRESGYGDAKFSQLKESTGA